MAGKLPGRALDPTTTITINNISFGDNVAVNSSVIVLGNSTVNTVVNSTAVVTPSVNVGSNIFVNTSTIHLGNSTVNAVIHTTGFTGNGAGLHSVNAAALEGNTVANILTSANTAANTLAAAAFTNAASRADAAYSNAVSYAASNTYVNNTFLPLAGGTLTGALTINATANIVSNLSANNVTFRGNVQIDGNLVVSGTSVTLNVASFAVEDNILHLNNGSTETHPDLGLAGNYNDGTYKHAGIFRDATDATWKVFDGYTPEPNTAFIDTSNASFRIAHFTANVITGASFSGNGASVTSVDAATVGGNTAATLRSYSDTVAATAYSNAINYSGNAALAYSNATSFASNADNISSGTLNTARLPATVNVATILNVGANSFVNTSAHFVGNGTVNSVLTSTTFAVGGNTATFGTAAYVVANGNVGVGTATPGNKLSVIGTFQASGNATISGSYLYVGQDIRANGQIRATGWYNTPSSSSDGPAIEIGVSGGSGYILSYDRDASVYKQMIFNANSFNFQTQGTQTGTYISNSSATHAFFASNGNVGIGTTSPAGLWSGDERALHIAGTGTTAAGVRLSANSTAEFFASGGSNVWGMYSSSDSPFVVYTNGTEKFRIGSEGGMGLNMGVTFNNNFIINGYTTVARMYSGADAVFGHNVYGDPNSRVLKQVNSNYYASWIRMYYNKGIHFGTSSVVGTAGDTVSDPAGTTNDKMILDIDGRLMLNTSTANTTANTILTVKGFTSNTSNFMIEGRDSNGVLRTAITDRGAQNWYIMAGDGLEKGSIRYSTPGGFVGILYFDSAGTSRSDFRHVANGGFTWHAHALGTVPPELMRLDNAGNLTIVGTLTESSSITLKENLDPIQDALGAITSLTGYVYDRKDGTAKRRAGLIAEEVESILPNVVKKDSDGNPTGIQYTNLIAYLVESIKELKAEIDILKSR